MNLNTEIGNEEPKNEELKDELNESKKSRERKDLEAKGSSNPKQHRKRRWTKIEDNLLTSLILKHGSNNWSAMEKEFNGTRSYKQICERWVNHLDPSIKKRKFNDNEIKLIKEELLKNASNDTKWVKIAKKIPGTTSLMVKNFYYNRLRKELSVNRTLDNDRLLILATIASRAADNIS